MPTVPYILVNPPQNLINPPQIHSRPLHLQGSSKAFALCSHAGDSVLPEASCRAPRRADSKRKAAGSHPHSASNPTSCTGGPAFASCALACKWGLPAPPPQHIPLAAWGRLQLHASCSPSSDRPGRFLGQTLCSTAVFAHARPQHCSAAQDCRVQPWSFAAAVLCHRSTAPGRAAALGPCSQSLKRITKRNGWCYFFFLFVRR